jgi:hypothetical protein
MSCWLGAESSLVLVISRIAKSARFHWSLPLERGSNGGKRVLKDVSLVPTQVVNAKWILHAQ